MKNLNFQPQFYLDHNATTALHPQVLSAVSEHLSLFGNASSIHWAGQKSKTAIRIAREKIAKVLNVSPLELIFTSGASESNNTVIQSVFQNSNKNEFICTQVEHPSVMKSMQAIESLGAVVHRIPVSRAGFLDLEFFKKVCGPKTALVSVMLANNETGNIFPIKEMVRISHETGALFHMDGVQGLGKMPLDLKDLNVDYASFSGHKFYALKGTGLLYVKKGTPLQPLIQGGAQERSRRGGTENLLGIVAMGAACDLASEISTQQARLTELRNHMECEILKRISRVTITGGEALRLSNTSSLIIPGVDGETLLMALDIKGFAVSTGAACSSGNPEPSPVLLAMGLSREEAQNSLRVSLGWPTTQQDVETFINELVMTVNRLREIHEQHASY